MGANNSLKIIISKIGYAAQTRSISSIWPGESSSLRLRHHLLSKSLTCATLMNCRNATMKTMYRIKDGGIHICYLYSYKQSQGPFTWIEKSLEEQRDIGNCEKELQRIYNC